MEMEVESYILYLLVYIKKHVLLQWVMKYYIEKNANLMLNISGENAVQVNCGFVTWALLSLDLAAKGFKTMAQCISTPIFGGGWRIHWHA